MKQAKHIKILFSCNVELIKIFFPGIQSIRWTHSDKLFLLLNIYILALPKCQGQYIRKALLVKIRCIAENRFSIASFHLII